MISARRDTENSSHLMRLYQGEIETQWIFSMYAIDRCYKELFKYLVTVCLAMKLRISNYENLLWLPNNRYMFQQMMNHTLLPLTLKYIHTRFHNNFNRGSKGYVLFVHSMWYCANFKLLQFKYISYSNIFALKLKCEVKIML